MDRIYFDHAATTPLDEDVLNKMLPYLRECYGNPDSPHGVGRSAMHAVDDARDTVAGLIGAKPNEVYFTSGGTEADNWALIGGARAQKAKGKTRVVVSSIEHHAVLAAAEELQKEGFSITYLPVNEGGRVALSDIRAALSDDVGVVALMAANNETGVLQPVREAAALAHKNGSLFFCDGVQAAPYMPLNVRDWDVDMLSFSAHKFYGPKGCGVLYIRGGVKMERLVAGGEQERGLRGGTVNVPSVVGLAAAYSKNVATMYASNEKIQRLRNLFLSEIMPLGGVTVNGDQTQTLPSVLNVRFAGVRNEEFLLNMDLRGVCVAAGSACASASVKPSHVLTAMGLTEDEARSSVRFSFGKNNTEEEILRGAALTKEIIERLRKFS
ncbi:MAG: cysteine desulfurase [Clostridia bacterium]|nr:cysteine desulfurase [Clostridia bacterium]